MSVQTCCNKKQQQLLASGKKKPSEHEIGQISDFIITYVFFFFLLFRWLLHLFCYFLPSGEVLLFVYVSPTLCNIIAIELMHLAEKWHAENILPAVNIVNDRNAIALIKKNLSRDHIHDIQWLRVGVLETKYRTSSVTIDAKRHKGKLGQTKGMLNRTSTCTRSALCEHFKSNGGCRA